MISVLETWRDIEGYEGLYQVSDFGEVRSLNYNRTGQTRVLKSCKDKGGYLQVMLCKDGKKKHHLVHRLVTQAFIDNPDNLPEVNHIDENKTNNCVENLEWCTAKYNSNHGTRNQRRAEARSEEVLQFTFDYVFVKEWASTRECGRNGFKQSNVSKCCNNRYGSQGNVYKGYRFVFAKVYYKEAVA